MQLVKCLFFFLTAISLFAQNGDIGQRAQGFINREPLWRQALGGAVLSLPSVQAQSAVVALDGGNIRAYSTAGMSMWNFPSRGRISPYVTRSKEGTSYFARTNGTLIAVNRAGRELWRQNIGGPLSAKVIPGWDGRIFVPADRRILCFTASGNLLWTRTFNSPFSITPKLDLKGGIIFALENNAVYRIDPFGNFQTWMLAAPPAALLSVENNQILIIYEDGTLGILGRAEDWFITAAGDNISLLPRLAGRPAAAANRGNDIAVLFTDGTVSLFSLDKKKIFWRSDSHVRELIMSGQRPQTEAQLIFNERGIYILSVDGATGFSHDGKRMWFKFLQNAASIPALSDEGILFSGGRDWILNAYRVEDRPLPARGGFFLPAQGLYGTGHPNPAFASEFPLDEFELIRRLRIIENGIRGGNVGNNELLWKSLLMMISNSDFHVRYRLASLNLLGQIGSRETVPWLLDFFRRETIPALRAEALVAIGHIGVDPNGIAIQTFMFMLVSGGGIRDEQVLLALTKATGAICRFSGPPLSETGVRILTLLTAHHQPPAVRRQAQREIDTLR